MRHRILQFPQVTQREVVEFWNRQYSYRNESLYAQNIARPLTQNRIRELFRWKNGGKLSQSKQQSAEKHFIKRFDELRDFSGDFEAAAFLHRFQGSGPIWRIFFLHIHRPEAFPIFDQHVFRAMRFIQAGQLAELPSNPGTRIHIYDQEYRPFYKGFGARRYRMVDKALWAFGKFLKLHYRFNEA